jgi:hypothetical protein
MSDTPASLTHHPHVRVLTAPMLAALRVVAPTVLTAIVFAIAAAERIVLSSPPNCGKTWISLASAIDAASRGVCVLMLFGEGALEHIGARTQALARSMGVDLDALDRKLILAHGSFPLTSERGLADFRELVARYSPGLVVIDPHVAFLVGDENSATDVRDHLRQIDTTLTACRASVLLAAHTAKPSQHGVAGSPRGSSALVAWTDAHYHLAKQPSDDPQTTVALLVSAKQRDRAAVADRLLTIRYDGTSATITTSPAPATKSRASSQSGRTGTAPEPDSAAVARVLASAQDWLGPTAIRVKLGWSGTRAAKALGDLVENGVVETRDGTRGSVYRLRGTGADGLDQ